MISIVLTNRDRDLNIVKKCLESLDLQSNREFNVFLVDYGSSPEYVYTLKKEVEVYHFIDLIICEVQGQLWNKSRAINIALKKCTTDFFFVGDIDMLFHTDFVKTLYKIRKEKKAIYFQVGFLSKEETEQNKDFLNSNVSFVSQKEATGMTLYPTELLKEINGYDEFYHGWGAEDTDVHIRLRNLGVEVEFYQTDILLKHQWHPKNYRTHQSKDPFHFQLEKINYSYIQLTQQLNKTKANIKSPWGVEPNKDQYLKLLENQDQSWEMLPEKSKLNAFLAQLSTIENQVISLIIKDATSIEKIKQKVKRTLRKKAIDFVSLEMVNDIILQEIIIHYKNLPYKYFFDSEKKEIHFKIYFP